LRHARSHRKARRNPPWLGNVRGSDDDRKDSITIFARAGGIMRP